MPSWRCTCSTRSKSSLPAMSITGMPILRTPLEAGFNDIGDYVLAFVTNNAYNVSVKTVQVYWSRRSLRPHPAPRPDGGLLWLSPERLRHRHPDGLHNGRTQRLQPAALRLIPIDADYRFNPHFDAYLGAMYNGVHLTVWPAVTWRRPTSTPPSESGTGFEIFPLAPIADVACLAGRARQRAWRLRCESARRCR